ncbi:hypothetical protein GE09DRAFT_1285632 [Coniochaeta sp. 2T2.1]|nr:hypothetical protein GE09DRAFT_1285632 [Coniochaeta sp. 2T2.1]
MDDNPRPNKRPRRNLAGAGVRKAPPKAKPIPRQPVGEDVYFVYTKKTDNETPAEPWEDVLWDRADAFTELLRQWRADIRALHNMYNVHKFNSHIEFIDNSDDEQVHLTYRVWKKEISTSRLQYVGHVCYRGSVGDGCGSVDIVTREHTVEFPDAPPPTRKNNGKAFAADQPTKKIGNPRLEKAVLAFMDDGNDRLHRVRLVTGHHEWNFKFEGRNTYFSARRTEVDDERAEATNGTIEDFEAQQNGPSSEARPFHDTLLAIGEPSAQPRARLRNSDTSEEGPDWYDAAAGNILFNERIAGKLYYDGLPLSHWEVAPTYPNKVGLKHGYDIRKPSETAADYTILSPDAEVKVIGSIWHRAVVTHRTKATSALDRLLKTDPPSRDALAAIQYLSTGLKDTRTIKDLWAELKRTETASKKPPWYLPASFKGGHAESFIKMQEKAGYEVMTIPDSYWSLFTILKSVMRLVEACLALCPQPLNTYTCLPIEGGTGVVVAGFCRFDHDQSMLKIHKDWLSLDRMRLDFGSPEDTTQVDLLCHTVLTLWEDLLKTEAPTCLDQHGGHAVWARCRGEIRRRLLGYRQACRQISVPESLLKRGELTVVTSTLFTSGWAHDTDIINLSVHYKDCPWARQNTRMADPLDCHFTDITPPKHVNENGNLITYANCDSARFCHGVTNKGIATHPFFALKFRGLDYRKKFFVVAKNLSHFNSLVVVLEGHHTPFANHGAGYANLESHVADYVARGFLVHPVFRGPHRSPGQLLSGLHAGEPSSPSEPSAVPEASPKDPVSDRLESLQRKVAEEQAKLAQLNAEIPPDLAGLQVALEVIDMLQKRIDQERRLNSGVLRKPLDLKPVPKKFFTFSGDTDSRNIDARVKVCLLWQVTSEQLAALFGGMVNSRGFMDNLARLAMSVAHTPAMQLLDKARRERRDPPRDPRAYQAVAISPLWTVHDTTQALVEAGLAPDTSTKMPDSESLMTRDSEYEQAQPGDAQRSTRQTHEEANGRRPNDYEEPGCFRRLVTDKLRAVRDLHFYMTSWNALTQEQRSQPGSTASLIARITTETPVEPENGGPLPQRGRGPLPEHRKAVMDVRHHVFLARLGHRYQQGKARVRLSADVKQKSRWEVSFRKSAWEELRKEDQSRHERAVMRLVKKGKKLLSFCGNDWEQRGILALLGGQVYEITGAFKYWQSPLDKEAVEEVCSWTEEDSPLRPAVAAGRALLDTMDRGEKVDEGLIRFAEQMIMDIWGPNTGPWASVAERGIAGAGDADSTATTATPEASANQRPRYPHLGMPRRLRAIQPAPTSRPDTSDLGVAIPFLKEMQEMQKSAELSLLKEAQDAVKRAQANVEVLQRHRDVLQRRCDEALAAKRGANRGLEASELQGAVEEEMGGSEMG